MQLIKGAQILNITFLLTLFASAFAAAAAAVCVCIYFLPPQRFLLTEQNNKSTARDQASNVVLRK